MGNIERIVILVDGNNFYHRVRELKLKHLLNLDYEKFSEFLTGKRKLLSKKYYIGAVREEEGNPKSKKLMQGQLRLTGKLQKCGWQIVFGQLLKIGNAYHEKGVDVQIAIDILIGAYENIYDTAMLVSSDSDLLPALDKIRSMKKKIEYIGFSHKPSLALITHSDVRRLLTKEDVQQFVL